MSAGEIVGDAHDAAAKASGILITVVVKRRIRRENLVEALDLLEEAAAAIRGVLTPSREGPKVGASTPDSSGESEDGTTDTRR